MDAKETAEWLKRHNESKGAPPEYWIDWVRRAQDFLKYGRRAKAEKVEGKK